MGIKIRRFCLTQNGPGFRFGPARYPTPAAPAACRVLPPALLHRLIVLAGARTRIGRLRVPIALEKGAEDVVAPVVAARDGDSDRGPAHQEAAQPE